ncbi:MAG: ATP-binding protein [Nitrospirae bacterium]|nr:ATP-binding protein [Nitrospirota bacterium]
MNRILFSPGSRKSGSHQPGQFGLKPEPHDIEREQAIIRLVVVVLISLYVLVVPVQGQNPPGLKASPQVLLIPLLAYALGIFVSIILAPGKHPVRRVIGIAGDLSFIALFMTQYGERGLPLGIVTLWVIMGNGFRYGKRYLWLATAIAALEFLAVFFESSFWQDHKMLFYSQLAGIIVLPLYMSVLLGKLEQMITLANQANQAKSRFLANMSHELRTPLNGIMGISELLRETERSPRQISLLNTLQGSTRHLSEIISKILDFSKLEAGCMITSSVVFDLGIAVTETINSLLPLARQKDLPLTAILDARIPEFLWGDPFHIKQILTNLLGNAIKFTVKGEVRLTVSPVPSSSGKTIIRLTVSDTGIGISEKDQGRIFESFVQGDDSVTKSFGGTGLGLSITRQLVDLLNGRIGLSSQEGVGSVFWCEIPFEPEAPPLFPNNFTAIRKDVWFWGSDESFRDLESELQAMGIEPCKVDEERLPFSSPSRQKSDKKHQTVFEKASPFYPCLVASLSQKSTGNFGTLLEKLSDHPFLSCTQRILLLPDDLSLEDLSIPPTGGIYLILSSNPTSSAFRRVFNWPDLTPVLESSTKKNGSRKEKPARTLSVLVADDHPVNRTILKGLLENNGHRVHLANDGEEALDSLQDDQIRFDLMILDLCMPGLGGLDVLKAHRFIERNNPVPTIILTANATEEARIESEGAKTDCFLTKPLDPSQLFAAIDRITLAQEGKPSSHTVSLVSLAQEGEEREFPLLDPELLFSLRGYSQNPAFLTQLIRGFIEDGKGRFSDLSDALDKGDYPLFMDSLHAMKGSALQLGAHRLAHLCQVSESTTAQDILSKDLLPMRMQFRDTFTRTLKEMDNLVERYPELFPGIGETLHSPPALGKNCSRPEVS